MAATAVVGLTSGQRLLSSSIYSSDLSDKLLHSVLDHGSAQLPTVLTRKVIVAKKNANFSPKSPSRPSKREKQAIRAVKEHITTTTITTTTTSTFYTPSIAKDWFDSPIIQDELQNPDMESSLEAIILLQKAMLEKQWNLSFDQSQETIHTGESIKKTGVIRSGVSARKRRNLTRRKCLPGGNSGDTLLSTREERGVSHDLLHNQFKGYIRGRVRVDHLSHADVVQLSKKIRAGLSVEEHKKRLKVKLGCEPSDQQLAASLRISCVELQSKLMECSLAREKLAMSNVRLVMAIAQKYDNMGADLADLIQGGLIGLLRGIEKFDSSKGFRISTYVYWWIRQGVSRALVDNSRTLRLPSHIHERLSSIRTAKTKLEESGITPTIAKIAEVLNMSEKKIRNAAEAATRVFSLDRDAFPSLNGLPGETFHSYIADTRLENNPWHGFEEWSLKDEVNTLLNSTLGEREQEIIRLYHGLESECQSWEEISRQIGLSRERVRQVGLVAMEKLKHAARRKKLEAMLVKH